MTPRFVHAAAAALVLLAGSAAALAQHDHSIIEIGVGTTGALQFHTHAAMPIPMPESIFPGYPGYATAEVAFESLQAPNAHGMVPLLPGSDIRVIMVSATAGLTLFNGLTPLGPGGELPVGSPFFHFLPLWTIDPGPLDGVFTANLRAHDAAGLQPDSDLFQVSFVTVPGPGTAVVLALGLAAAGRRRRS